MSFHVLTEVLVEESLKPRALKVMTNVTSVDDESIHSKQLKWRTCKNFFLVQYEAKM